MFGGISNHCHVVARRLNIMVLVGLFECLLLRGFFSVLKFARLKKNPKQHSLKVIFLTPVWKGDFIALDIWRFSDHPTDGTWAATILSMNKKTEAMAFQQYEFFRLYYFVSLRQETVLLVLVCAEWVIWDKCVTTPCVQYVQILWTSWSCCAPQAAKYLSWTIHIC